jgi:hypothetical protein
MADRATAAARIIAALAVLVLSASCAACTLVQPAPGQRAAGTRADTLLPGPGPGRRNGGQARAGRSAAGQPGLDRGRGGPGRPVRRRLHHLVL